MTQTPEKRQNPEALRRVLDVLREAGETGATCFEIAGKLGVSEARIRPRMTHLRHQQQVVFRLKGLRGE
jgi:hypothetical protein